jgi:hypothetical protein
MTLLSRITGLARESLKATAFGAGLQMDAFEAAFRLPNLLRRLFAEGAFSQAFVPILAEYHRQRGPDETRLLVGRVGTVLALALLGVTLLGVLGAPWLVYLLAGGFAQTPGKVELTAEMIRIVFPYILFISLTSLAGGVLNVYRRFAIPAFTPVLLNVAIIAAALFLAPHVDPPIVALAWGVFVGGIAQLAFQVRPLIKLAMLPRPSFDLSDPGVRRVLRAMGPAVVGVSAAQISALINTQLAALLGNGAISWITYADRLMEFPSALLGVALGTVLLPSLAQHHSDANHAQYSALLDWGLRLAFLLALPAAVGPGPGIAARVDALPVRQVHRCRRMADARRALVTASDSPADPGQDSGAGLLREAADAHAGEGRVPDGGDHASACGALRVGRRARSRGTHPRDECRRLRQRRLIVLAVAQARVLRTATGLAALRGQGGRRVGRAGCDFGVAVRRARVLAPGRLVGKSGTAGRRDDRRRRGVFCDALSARIPLRRFQPARRYQGVGWTPRLRP